MQIRNTKRKNNPKNIRPTTGKFGKGKIVEIDDVVLSKENEPIEFVEVGQDDFDNDRNEEKIDYLIKMLVRIELSKAYRFKKDLAKFITEWN